MLKLYKPQAEQLLLAAAYLKAMGSHIPLEETLAKLRTISAPSPSDQNTLNNARKGLRMPEGGKHWLDDTLKRLYEGLAEEQNGRGESDLVDQIVRACQLPFGRNIMSGESMRRLRAAILLPSEQAGLTQRLRQREMSCGACGIILHDRESVTLVVDGNGGQAINCHRCMAPQSVPCASCHETASLSSKAMNAMSRMQCPSCQEAKKEKKHPSDPHAPEPNLPPADPGRPIFTGGRTAGRATQIPVPTRAVPWGGLNDGFQPATTQGQVITAWPDAPGAPTTADDGPVGGN